MGLSGFFNTTVGQYVIQNVLHALVGAIVVHHAIRAWAVSDPLTRQRLFLLVVLCPPVFLPLYQLINPERGSISFRLGSVLDMNRWFSLEFHGVSPAGWLLVLILSGTTLVFLFQEMIPIILHSSQARHPRLDGDEPAELAPLVAEAASGFRINEPRVLIVSGDGPAISSTSGRSPGIFISKGLFEALDREQLKAALLHEMAHIERNKKPLLITVFLFRVMMFFNPVVLLIFRKVVQEEEMICDDLSASRTKNPHALARVLEMFYHADNEREENDEAGPVQLIADLERQSHDLLIKKRIERLEGRGPQTETAGGRAPFFVSACFILLINYFIV